MGGQLCQEGGRRGRAGGWSGLPSAPSELCGPRWVTVLTVHTWVQDGEDRNERKEGQGHPGDLRGRVPPLQGSPGLRPSESPGTQTLKPLVFPFASPLGTGQLVVLAWPVQQTVAVDCLGLFCPPRERDSLLQR